jgi:hypothetical protein
MLRDEKRSGKQRARQNHHDGKRRENHTSETD